MAALRAGVVIRKEKTRATRDTAYAVTIKNGDGSVKTIIGKAWYYPELATCRTGDRVTYAYGDTAGLSQFDIDWANSSQEFTVSRG